MTKKKIKEGGKGRKRIIDNKEEQKRDRGGREEPESGERTEPLSEVLRDSCPTWEECSTWSL